MDAGELSSLRPRTPEPPRSDPGAEPSASGLWRAGAGLPTAGWWRGAGSDPVPAAREAAPSGRRPTFPYLAAQLGHHMDATFSRVKGNLERNQPGGRRRKSHARNKKTAASETRARSSGGCALPRQACGGPGETPPSPRARTHSPRSAPCGLSRATVWTAEEAHEADGPVRVLPPTGGGRWRVCSLKYKEGLSANKIVLSYVTVLAPETRPPRSS